MKGKVGLIKTNKTNGLEYGFIKLDNGQSIYFDSRSLSDGLEMSDFYKGDTVEYSSTFTDAQGRPSALGVRLIEKDNTGDTDKAFEQHPLREFYTPGYYRNMDRVRMREEHLKPNSGEYEVLQKLKSVLYVSHIGHHDMGFGGASFPFCLIGATEFLKPYIHGMYEFLLLFSHFDNRSWQQNTVKAISFIRKRKEIAERRPLVNFYILISNAIHLKSEIDKMKGGTDAAIIPFTFEEILNCESNSQLERLILDRFGEYLFENNMLGEENPIEDEQLLFGDRGKIADSIVQRCREGKHSGIFGLRRSGKSSVLRAVTRRLDNAEIKYSVIEARSELEPVDSWKTALFDIAKHIRIDTTGFIQGDDESRHDFQERLRLASTEDDYEKRPTQCFVEDVKLYTRDFPNFVLAIDEIELITYNTATSLVWQSLDSYKGFWGALRDSGCSLIVCGVNSTINERSIIEYKGASCDNPMYERIHNCADFSKTYLPIFTDEQTKYMLNTLGSYSNVAFNEIYVDINRTFGGQPYAIRQFSAFMFDNIKQYRSPDKVYEISKPTFSALVSEFNNSVKGSQVFETILQHLCIYKEEHEMLKKFALTPGKYKKVESDDVSIIDHLIKYGLIEYDALTCFIDFTIYGLKDYICRTETKSPSDMSNDERRQYIQDKVQLCERKLKKYIIQYFTYHGGDVAGIAFMKNCFSRSQISINPRCTPTPDINSCQFTEFFDHKKFIMYFSSLKKIIRTNWNTLGIAIQNASMSKDQFGVYMDQLNAGRTDADHYDPEDMTYPDEWQIGDKIMDAFMTAFNEFDELFKKLHI